MTKTFLAAALLLISAPAMAQSLPRVPKCSATNVECIERQIEAHFNRGNILRARANAEYKLMADKANLVDNLTNPVEVKPAEPVTGIIFRPGTGLLVHQHSKAY